VRAIRKIRWWLPTEDFDGLDCEKARTITMSGLIWYAQIKGYRPGWAVFRFLRIYGVWPNGECLVQPEPPRGELAWWINQQNALYATAKRRERIRTVNES
jgi:hypothetical protein